MSPYITRHYLRPFIPHVLYIMITIGLGFLFLFLPVGPGIISNWIAWFETEGTWAAHTLGILFLLLGIIRMLCMAKAVQEKSFSLRKGSTTCSISEKLIEEIVQHLWNDYFQRTDLPIHASLEKKRLVITGDLPPTWDDTEDLLAYISKNLLSQTGYWGDIVIYPKQPPH